MKTAVAAGALSATGCSRETAADARPNIVLIMADDMGFSDIGCYGGEIETPVINSLAVEGLRFRQFYNTARCCPTRAALMTGLGDSATFCSTTFNNCLTLPGQSA